MVLRCRSVEKEEEAFVPAKEKGRNFFLGATGWVRLVPGPFLWAVGVRLHGKLLETSV